LKNLDDCNELQVPEAWKANPLIMKVTDYILEGKESLQMRMKRWEEAQAALNEMGFNEYPFIQKILILQYDGNVKLVVNDLLVRNGQVDQITTTFEKLSDSILHLFRSFAHFIHSHGKATIEAGGQQLAAIGSQMDDGLQAGAQFLQDQVEANKVHIQKLQSEIGKNVQNLNEGGEELATNVNSGLQHANQGIQRIQERGAQVSFATIGVLSDTVRQLGTLFACASRDMNQPPAVMAHVCGQCNSSIVGARYLCAACDNLTLCELCEVTHNRDHVLIKVRTPQGIQTHPYLTSSCIDLLNTPPTIASLTGPSNSDEVEQTNPTAQQQQQQPLQQQSTSTEQSQPQSVQSLDQPTGMAPAPEAQEDPQEAALKKALKTLKEMGFNDDMRTRDLLLQNNLNVENVVHILLTHSHN